jgi:hypothetical protein
MTLATLPLFAGYVPILFKRRGFPDWLAHTLVIDAPQLSVAEARRATIRTARDRSERRPPAISPETGSTSSTSGDGSGPGIGGANRRAG